MTGPVPAIAVEEVFCLHRTADGDVAALQGATLHVAAGERLGVLGPSGAGKTTLLRVIGGLQLPQAGRVCLDGVDIGRLPARERSRLRHRAVGFLAQTADALVAPELRAERAVEVPLALRGVRAAERRRRAAELLERVGLDARRSALGGELSGGERQRLALCVAIAHRPALLLADEPTASLDGEAARSVLNAISDLAAADGLTAVVVTHDPATAAALPRTVRISDGRIAEEALGGGEASIVVGRGGWIQLPEAMLDRAGLGSRLQAEAREGELVLRSRCGPSVPAAAPDPPAPASPAIVSADTPRPREPVAIALEHVTRRALRDLTLAFAPGRLTVVAGASGSGKTTLLRLLCGLDLPDAGTVRFGGRALQGLDPEARAAVRRSAIGYLAQEPAPIGFLSAMENIALALTIRGWPPGEAEARAAEVLRAVGLTERGRQRVERLSAGEAQRAALARALAGARGLLLVDEPTSRLDRANARRVAELLGVVARDGQTVICATHDEDLVDRADAVITL